jgi:hypothetical protein
MNCTRFLLVGVVALALGRVPSSVLTQDSETPPEPYEVAEAYQVYAAILQSVSPPWPKTQKEIFIRTETGDVPCGASDQFGEKEAAEVAEAIDDYVRMNKKTWLLQNHLPIDMPYDLVPRDDTSNGLEKFHELHPDAAGWTEFSAVGFSADRSIAAVSVMNWCSSVRECGNGNGTIGLGASRVLVKKNGKWQPLKNGRGCQAMR